MENKKSKKVNYTLGLDIGVESVGWAAVTSEGDLVRTRAGLPAWGVVEFEKAKTAQDRRIKRGARRSLRRKKVRLNELKKIFEEMGTKVESQTLNKYLDTIGKKAKYPTIYHLQADLFDGKIDFVDNPQKDNEFSVENKNQILYMALHNFYKHRGHFLNGTKSKKSVDNNDLNNEINELMKKILTESEDLEEKKIFEAINKKISNLKGLEKKWMVFLTGDENSEKIKFDDDNFSEKLATIKDEYRSLIEKLQHKFMNDFINELLRKRTGGTHATFVHKKIEQYEFYKYTLNHIKEYGKLLKDFKEEYEKYRQLLKVDIHNALKYLNNKNISEIVGRSVHEYIIDMEKSNQESDYYKLVSETPAKDFFENVLKNQRHGDNHAIPVGMTLYIVETIAKNYIDDKVAKENLEKLLVHKLPYYVGPIYEPKDKNLYKNEFAWLVKNEEYKNKSINYLNWEEAIDLNQTASAFIKRMRGKCSYMLDEYAAAKDSITYQKFAIYNELNNIRYSFGERSIALTKQQKEKIFKELFCKQKKITAKKLNTHLNDYEGIDTSNIVWSGFQDKNNPKFMNQNSTYIDFFEIDPSLVKEENSSIVEEIIDIIAVLPNDGDSEKKMKKIQIDSKLKNINLENDFDDVLKKLAGKQFNGFGNLSLKFINGKKFYKLDKYNNISSKNTILGFMIEEGKNIQSIITNLDYYGEKIKYIDENGIEHEKPKTIRESVGFDEVANLYINSKNDVFAQKVKEIIPNNPALRRGVLMTIKAVREIVNNIGIPDNIIIESTREDDPNKKNKLIKSEMKVIEELEKQLKNIKKYGDKKTYEKNDKLRRKYKLYLEQEGKCMYSGAPLKLENLSAETEIDHIVPRSKKVNNAQYNLVLVTRKENQDKGNDVLKTYLEKSDRYIKQLNMWKSLLANNKITKRKFELLTLDESEYKNELEKMLNRSLVETSQIIYNVKNLLSATKFVKNAEFVNQKTGEVIIRKEPNIQLIKAQILNEIQSSEGAKYMDIPKDRTLTPQHHAIDAMFVAVLGNKLIDAGIFELASVKLEKELKKKNEKSISTAKINNIISKLYAESELGKKLRSNIDQEWFYSRHLNKIGKDNNLFDATIDKNSEKTNYQKLIDTIVSGIEKEKEKDIKQKNEIVKVIKESAKIYSNQKTIFTNITNKVTLSEKELVKINQIIFKKLHKFNKSQQIAKYKTVTTNGVLAKVSSENKIEKILFSISNTTNNEGVEKFITKNNGYKILTRNDVLKIDNSLIYIQSETELKNYAPIRLSLEKQIYFNNLANALKENPGIEKMQEYINEYIELFERTNVIFSSSLKKNIKISKEYTNDEFLNEINKFKKILKNYQKVFDKSDIGRERSPSKVIGAEIIPKTITQIK
jgi:CRISPR-associated endonuclease Csn1